MMEGNVDFSSLTTKEAIMKKQQLRENGLREKESSLLENGVLLTKERKAILELPFADLLKKLKDGRLKSTEVLKAFQAKALLETQKTNCITEFVPQAKEWAIERDATPLEKKGILHGLPVSVKENFDIEGMDTTMGLTKRLGKPSMTNSVAVSALLKQGAVPFVKTNVPQIIYSVGCSNPIFGATKNPLDLERSPGGSSGGEAALIKGGGSVLGLGTDMCGSVRIPAIFCGTLGLKTTQKRISKEGSYGTYKRMIGVANACGFLASEPAAIAAAMEASLQDGYMSTLDPMIPDLPWRKHLFESKKSLKIGWFEQDDFFPVTAGIKRAIRVAKESLERRGHELIPFSPPSMEHFYDFGINILMSEGGRAMAKLWEGEIVDESIAMNKNLISASYLTKLFMEKYIGIWSSRLSKFATQEASKSTDLWEDIELLKLYTDDLITSWKNQNLDALLGPAFPLATPHPSEHGTLMPACIYLAVYNYVDFPCGTVPVTYENKVDQSKLEEYPTDDFVFQSIKKTCAGATGMPLSVQIAGLPWQEEIVLRAMQEIRLGLQSEDNV